jgi:hypothetical protein
LKNAGEHGNTGKKLNPPIAASDELDERDEKGPCEECCE